MLSPRRYAQFGILSAAMVLCLSVFVLFEGRESLQPHNPLQGLQISTHSPTESQVVFGGANAHFNP